MHETPLILIVDDESIIREILVKMIHTLGYTAMQASNSTEAQNIIRQHQPDLVLLDMVMPGVDSMEVLKSIRANSALKHISVILISGIDDLESVANFIEAGIDDFLPKPFNMPLFTLKINSCLAHMVSKERSLDAKKCVDKFCRDLSHDLNNALTGIMMTAELLLMNATNDHEKDHLADIIDSSEKVGSLIKKHRQGFTTNSFPNSNAVT